MNFDSTGSGRKEDENATHSNTHSQGLLRSSSGKNLHPLMKPTVAHKARKTTCLIRLRVWKKEVVRSESVRVGRRKGRRKRLTDSSFANLSVNSEDMDI